MSNNPNFVSELVQMAKAFEELPVVQAALTESRQQVSEKDVTIHELEGRIIDLTNALDAAHAATAKAEVERDHAETMFLEADDAKMAAVRAMRHIIDEANGLIQIVQPTPKSVEPEPVAQPEAKAIDSPLYQDPQMDLGPQVPTADPSQATNTDGQSGTTSQVEGGGSGSMDSPQGIEAIHDPAYGVAPDASTTFGSGQSEPGPTATGTVGESATVPTQSVEAQNAANTTSLNPGMDSSAPQDDVGYHNEPTPHYSTVWYQWAVKMDDRYGAHSWPSRS